MARYVKEFTAKVDDLSVSLGNLNLIHHERASSFNTFVYLYTHLHTQTSKKPKTKLFKGSEIGSGRYMDSGSVGTKHIFFIWFTLPVRLVLHYLFINSSVYICIFVVLGIQPRVSHMLGQCSITEFHAKCLFWMF